MRLVIATVLAVLFLPGAAAAMTCADWSRLSPADKDARFDAMVDGHLNSNTSRSYTSENPALMRRCLMGFKQDLIAQFDGACLDPGTAPMDAIDEIFDRYFLSCVQ